MRICGVEIKGTEAVLCILQYKEELFSIPESRFRKIDYSKQNRTSDLFYFQKTFKKFCEDYNIDLVVIKERPLKGKFAGGAMGFKMEAAIQLIDDIKVETFNSQQIKQLIKRNPIPVEYDDTGLKIFQKPSFELAYAYHMFLEYGVED